MAKMNDLYRTVYTLTRNEAATPTMTVSETHKQFAQALPAPDQVSEADAAALCSLVIVSGQWGLEGFYPVPEPTSGLMLGEYVRRELPDYQQRAAKARELVERYRPRGA